MGKARQRTATSYSGLSPASHSASRVGRGNRKRDTEPERLLKRALWTQGVRFRVDAADLPGRPDIVFRRVRLAVFCDGDFWHGREWRRRRRRLARGSNAAYWIAKIKRNRERDRRNNSVLARSGWAVLRLWESEIRTDPSRATLRVVETLSRLGRRSDEESRSRTKGA